MWNRSNFFLPKIVYVYIRRLFSDAVGFFFFDFFFSSPWGWGYDRRVTLWRFLARARWCCVSSGSVAPGYKTGSPDRVGVGVIRKRGDIFSIRIRRGTWDAMIQLFDRESRTRAQDSQAPKHLYLCPEERIAFRVRDRSPIKDRSLILIHALRNRIVSSASLSTRIEKATRSFPFNFVKK